jgi:zinc transport system permease protein
MFDLLGEMFYYSFIVRALMVGVMVALVAALLGVSLVLKRYSMIGDGLSHVGFGSLAIAMALGLSPLQISIPVVVLAAFMLLRISENSKIKGDAAIALISSSSLAIGVIVVAMTTGMNTDVCNYMFGSILAMKMSDVYLSICLSVVVLILYVLFYNKIFAITFDENFARATGVKAGRYNMLIALLTALTIVIGMRLMGALLISSLIIFPALTSMRVFGSFKAVVICSAILSVCCFFIGITASFALSIPAGASVVAVNILAVLICTAIGLMKKHMGVVA